MRTHLGAVSVLAGGLFLAPIMFGHANAQTANLKGAFAGTQSVVTLVGHGGGGGGGGGEGGHGGGGGGNLVISGGGGGGGGGGRDHGDGGGGGGRVHGDGGDHVVGAMGVPHGARFAGRIGSDDGRFAANRVRIAEDGRRGMSRDDRDHNHMVRRDRDDHDFDDRFIHRHRFNEFAFWWPGYYGYGNSCDWLWRKASITGSRYWWDRYYACANYRYY